MSCPLNIFWNFPNQKVAEVLQAEAREVESYIVNVIYTVVGQPFRDFVKTKIDDQRL